MTLRFFNNFKRFFLTLFLSIFCFTACSEGESEKKTGPTLKVLVPQSFIVPQNLVRAFEKKYGCQLYFLRAGSSQQVLQKALLCQKQYLADVLYGVDNSYWELVHENDLLAPLELTEPEDLEPFLTHEKRTLLTPVDYIDVCMNYSQTFFEKTGLAPPTSLEDLCKEEYRGLFALPNPATSSMGTCFLLASELHLKDQAPLFWKKLLDNNPKIVSSWQEAYNLFSKGRCPLFISYVSSFIEGDPALPLDIEGLYFRQVHYAGILKHAKQSFLANRWIEYMQSREFQQEWCRRSWLLSIRSKVEQEPELAKLRTVKQVYIPKNTSNTIEKWLHTLQL